MPLSERDRKTLIIGGSVVGGFLLLFLVYKLFLSGGGTSSAGASPVIIAPSTSVSVSPSPSPSPSPTPASGGVTTFGGRDPWCMPQSYVSRMVALGLALPTGAYLCPGVVTPTPSSSTSPTPSGSHSPSPSSTAPSAPVGSSAVVGGRTVVLIGTSTSRLKSHAQIEVNGKVYSVDVGSTFAGGSLRLQSVSGRCATVLYGDQPFGLCDG